MRKVSIIVPVYNVEKYLGECLDSILNQSYSNLEVILVDDGSPDNCGDICDNYLKKDNRIKVIHQKNGGLSNARNSGLNTVTGEYMLFFDSDDILLPNAIETLINKAEKYNLDFVLYEALNFSEDSIDLETTFKYIIKGKYDQVFTGSELLQLLLDNKSFRTPVQLYLYKTAFVNDNNMKFHDGIIHEDWEFTSLAFFYAKRVMIEQSVLYKHRLRGNSIMGTKISQKNVDGYYAALITLINKMNKKSHKCYKNLVMQLYELVIGTSKIASDKKRFIIFRYKLVVFYKLLIRMFYSEKRIVKICIYSFIPTFIVKLIVRLKSMLKKNSIDSESKHILKILHQTKKDNNRIIMLCCPHLHGNRGDIAISLAQKYFLETNFVNKCLVEVPTLLCEFHSNKVIKELNNNDILCICGGGWFGSLWRHNELAALNIVKHYSNNKIVIFPQTIYYSDDTLGNQEFQSDKKLFASLSDLTICLRDNKSYDIALSSGLFNNNVKVLYTPDMVLALDINRLKLKRNEETKGVLYCLRDDAESILSTEKKLEIIDYCRNRFRKCDSFSTNIPNSTISLSKRESALKELLEKINSAELIITDRLHCMIFSYLLCKPCIAYDNLTHKVSGVYNWIKPVNFISLLSKDDDFISSIENVMISCQRKRKEFKLNDIVKVIEEIYNG